MTFRHQPRQVARVPSVTFPRALLLTKLRRVCVLMQITIGVLQTPKQQSFAIQCLEAYLGALRKLPEQGYTFDDEELPEDGDHTHYRVSKLDDGPPVAQIEITRQVRLDRIVVTDREVHLNMTGQNDGEPYCLTITEEPAADAAPDV